MKRIVFTALLTLVAAGGQTLAADLPPAPLPRAPATYVPIAAPVYNWSGFYVGGNAGWGFANGDSTVTETGNAFFPGTFTSTSSGSLNGFIAGGQVGVNFQINALVLGIEGDFQWSGQKKSDTFGCGLGIGCTANETVKVPWFGTARGRIGFAADRVLFYATGGAAWLNFSDSLSATAAGVTTTLSPSTTVLGWTAGAGIEVAFGPNWTGKIEYLYVQASPTLTATIPATLGGGTITETLKGTDNIIRAGINFKFGS